MRRTLTKLINFMSQMKACFEIGGRAFGRYAALTCMLLLSLTLIASCSSPKDVDEVVALAVTAHAQ